MANRKYYHLGYVLLALIAVMTMGLTQCQSNADSMKDKQMVQVAPPQPAATVPSANSARHIASRFWCV